MSRDAFPRDPIEREFDDVLRRDVVDAPDLTDRILSRVHSRRPFLSSRLHRFVRAGRLAAGAGFLLGVLAVVLAQRAWPERVILRPEPAPASTFLAAAQSDAVRRFASLPDVPAGVSTIGERTIEACVRATHRAPAQDPTPARSPLLNTSPRPRSHPLPLRRVRARIDPFASAGPGGAGDVRLLAVSSLSPADRPQPPAAVSGRASTFDGSAGAAPQILFPLGRGIVPLHLLPLRDPIFLGDGSSDRDGIPSARIP